ncbi:MAG: hypothetical protein AAF730_06565 [Bacteroidota bacterium]
MRERLRPALDHYHQLIANDFAAAEQQMGMLHHLQREGHVLFGDRTMAHSLRPTFLTEQMYTRVQDTTYLVRQAIIKIAAAFFNNEDLLKRELGLFDWEISLASIPTNVMRLSATSRMDSFITANSFKFVEVNGESPAGLAYVHSLAEIYEQLPIFQQFTKRFPVRFVSPQRHLIHSLVHVYQDEFGGRKEKPHFAIVDRLDTPTIHEFHLLRDYLHRLGYGCEVLDPRALECRDGWVYANGQKIDILYRRLLLKEYYDIKDDCTAFLEGYKAQKTCYLNSFRTNLVHKKALFVFLTDEQYTRILTPAEQYAIAEHIPWTRRLRDQRTQFRGLDIDLVPFIRNNRSYFVIKPNDGYGGQGVTLGFNASAAEWDQAIATGLRYGHVVQEKVDIHREPFLVQQSGGWEMVPSVIDLDPYIVGPMMGGCLTRISSTDLANVTAGGGTLPMFILRYA